MIYRQAIKFNRNNVSAIADLIADYSAEDLLADNDYLLNAFGTVVLCVDVIDEELILNSVVTESVFWTNVDPSTDINDKTFSIVFPPR